MRAYSLPASRCIGATCITRNAGLKRMRSRAPLIWTARAVMMEVTHADILQATVKRANITMADLFTRERFVNIDGQVHGPASSATAIVMSSPLKKGRAARLSDIEISDDIAVKLDMNIGLFPQAPREVLGQAQFAGNQIVASKENITLDDFKGTVSFTRGDWYGEDIFGVIQRRPGRTGHQRRAGRSKLRQRISV